MWSVNRTDMSDFVGSMQGEQSCATWMTLKSKDMIIERKFQWDTNNVLFSVLHRGSGVRSKAVAIPVDVAHDNSVFVARVVASLAEEVETLVDVFERMKES